MAKKSALYVLAVFVLMGSMAVVALADDRGMNMYGPPDASLSADPERSIGQVDVGEIREPVETGALPHESMTEDPEGWVNISAAEQDSSPELRGRPNIQSGGGGE